MSDWRELAATGKFEEAEPLMLDDTGGPDGPTLDAEARAEFYEKWGDALRETQQAKEKYHVSHYYWATFASWSTSGGEGTARMRDANRVLLKLEVLRSKTDDADR